MSPFLGRRVVLFDAGFTLLEPVRSVAATYIEEAAALGVAPAEEPFRERLREVWRRLDDGFRSADPELRTSELAERAAWALFTAEVAAPFPDLRARHGAWHERLVARFDAAAAWRPTPGAEALLRELRRSGRRLGVLSNWHSALHGILTAHGLADRLDVVLTSAEIGRKKPHPESFAEALRRLDAEPAEALHVGDSLRDDVEGARAAGLAAVWISARDAAAPLVQETPRFASLADLGAALNP